MKSHHSPGSLFCNKRSRRGGVGRNEGGSDEARSQGRRERRAAQQERRTMRRDERRPNAPHPAPAAAPQGQKKAGILRPADKW
jgi:hypothetical protein